MYTLNVSSSISVVTSNPSFGAGNSELSNFSSKFWRLAQVLVIFRGEWVLGYGYSLK